MADNYLENRMEAYRSGRLATHNRTSASMRAPRRSNQLTITYPPMTVLIVADESGGLVADTLSAFTSTGCRVAFTSPDIKVSTSLAQRTGARYYPAGMTFDSIMNDIMGHWGVPDVILLFDPDSDSIGKLSESVRMINARRICENNRGTATAVLARHLLYLSHPDNAFLLDSSGDFA